MPTSPTIRDRILYQDVSLQLSIVAGSDPSATLIAAKDQHHITVRRITIIVTTTAAVALIFRTSNATPVILVNLEASKDEGIYEFPFGEKGFDIAENEALALFAASAGVAAIVIVDAHRRPAPGLVRTPAQA